MQERAERRLPIACLPGMLGRLEAPESRDDCCGHLGRCRLREIEPDRRSLGQHRAVVPGSSGERAEVGPDQHDRLLAEGVTDLPRRTRVGSGPSTIATIPSAQSIPPTSVAKIPAASLPGSCSWGRKTSCPAARRAAATSAFQERSGLLNSGLAKYSLSSRSIANRMCPVRPSTSHSWPIETVANHAEPSGQIRLPVATVTRRER